MKNNLIKVKDPNSIFFNKKGKFIEEADDSIGLLIDDDLVFFKKDQVILKEKKLYIPQSRKHLYEFIQNQKNQREDIEKTLNFLIENNQIECLTLSKEDFIEKILDVGVRKDIVNVLRTLRDEEKIRINLINNLKP